MSAQSAFVERVTGLEPAKISCLEGRRDSQLRYTRIFSLKLAENLPYTDGILCPVMDARRSQVYNALFRRTDKGLIRLCEDRLIPLAELDAELSEMGEKVYLCGDGYALAKDKLSVKTEDTPTLLIPQNAVSIALLAKRTYENAPTEDYREESLQPIYLRASQAERERLEKEAASK